MKKWIFAWLLTGLIAGCTGDGAGDPEGTFPPNDNDPDASADELPRADIREEDRLRPYRADSPYASFLKQCALTKTQQDACELSQLPFIGQAGAVTRDSIMDRLLVTHDWMGVRFEQVLQEAPDDLIQLFASLTSISIGSTVRPSYYWTVTGAIRLDPAGLWHTVYEKSTVATVEDFRSDYGKDLQFWALGSLRQNGQRVQNYYPLTDYQVRGFEDIKIPMFRLLYHELAHAVDFMSPGRLDSLSTAMRPYEAVQSVFPDWLAPRLQSSNPLFSGVLQRLAHLPDRRWVVMELCDSTLIQRRTRMLQRCLPQPC